MSKANRMRLLALGVLAAVIVGMGIAVSSSDPVSAAGTGTLRVEPAAQNVNEGTNFTFKTVQNASVDTSGVQTNLSFDQTKIQLISIARGAPYTGSSLLAGVAPQTIAQAIAEANTTGLLKNVGVFFSPGAGSVAPGDRDAVIFTAQAASCGNSQMTLSAVEMLDANGDPVAVTLGPTNSVNIACATPTPDATPSPGPTGTPGPTPTPIPPSSGQVNVTGSIGGGFLNITVPANVTIPLEREVINTADVGVGIDSNTTWQLNVSDPKSTNTGFMTSSDATPKVLKNAMRVAVGATQIDLRFGGTLISGSGDSLVNSQLRQLVVAADLPGAYGIQVLYVAVGTF